MHEFLPHLDVLPLAQRRLWPELSVVPKEFVLYGGTAVALHLGRGHRTGLTGVVLAQHPPNFARSRRWDATFRGP
jgi:hypothetical protein